MNWWAWRSGRGIPTLVFAPHSRRCRRDPACRAPRAGPVFPGSPEQATRPGRHPRPAGPRGRGHGRGRRPAGRTDPPGPADAPRAREGSGGAGAAVVLARLRPELAATEAALTAITTRRDLWFHADSRDLLRMSVPLPRGRRVRRPTGPLPGVRRGHPRPGTGA